MTDKLVISRYKLIFYRQHTSNIGKLQFVKLSIYDHFTITSKVLDMSF